ncbi:hypothetical protein [Spirosoma gilvum]
MGLAWLDSIPFMTGLDASYLPAIDKQLRSQFFESYGLRIPITNCCLNHNEREITIDGEITYLETDLIIGIYGFPCTIGWRLVNQVDGKDGITQSIECWWEKFHREQILIDYLRRRLERKQKAAKDPFLKSLHYKARVDPTNGLDITLRFQSEVGHSAEIANTIYESVESWNKATLLGNDQGLIHNAGELKKVGKYYTIHIDLGSSYKGALNQLLLHLNAKSSLIKKLEVI